MNTQIYKLAIQAGFIPRESLHGIMENGIDWSSGPYGYDKSLQKFAELIIEECIEVVEKQKVKMSYGPSFVIQDIKQNFGVEE
jgi:hypothetical protein